MITKPTRTARELLGRYSIFDLLRYQVEAGETRFDVVCLELSDWVTVVPVTAEGQLVLVRQPRFGIDAISLETPGGIVDEGESPEQAAARELREETGYLSGELRSLGWVHPNPAFQNNRMHFMLAPDVTPTGRRELDEHESTEVVLAGPDQVRRWIEQGQITHALVSLALERALARM